MRRTDPLPVSAAQGPPKKPQSSPETKVRAMLRAIGRYNSLFLVMAIYLQPIAHSTHSGNERVSWHFQLVTQSLDIHRQRYIRLTYLIPSILQMVDDGRIAFNPAVEISYMTEEHQTWLKEEMDMCDATPSLVQSRTLKDMSRNGTLTENYLHTLLTEEKPNQRQKFFLNQSDVQQYFPSSYTPQQMQNVIISLLRNWEHKRSSRQRPQHEEELER